MFAQHSPAASRSIGVRSFLVTFQNVRPGTVGSTGFMQTAQHRAASRSIEGRRTEEVRRGQVFPCDIPESPARYRGVHGIHANRGRATSVARAHPLGGLKSAFPQVSPSCRLKSAYPEVEYPGRTGSTWL